MRLFRHLCHAVLLVACLGGVTDSAETNLLPNPDFTAGTDAPAGWTLSGGEGRWADRDVLGDRHRQRLEPLAVRRPF